MRRLCFIPSEKQVLASMRIRTQSPPKSPLWDATHPNPGIRKVQRSLASFAREAASHSRANLFKMVGMLAESKELNIHACALCLVLPDGNLTTVAMHNFDPSGKKQFDASERSIVAEVYRTESEYYAKDVTTDMHYYDDLKNTKSQFTVPIFWSGKLIGILNGESPVADGFSAKAQAYIKSKLPSLVFDLLILKSIESGDMSWCPWHPEIHGWDFSRHLETICREVATRICPTTVKMAVWYPDVEKDELTVLGTHGYDWNYVTDSSLRLSTSQIGLAFSRQDVGIQKLDVNKFVKADKAAQAGIKEAYAIKIPGSDASREATGIITCYLTAHPVSPKRVDRNVRELALQAIEYCAYLCSHLIRSYLKQKESLALAKIQQAISEHAELPKSSQIELAASVIRKVLQAPMQSTFRLDSSGEGLRCIQTTGFCQERRGRLTRSLNRKKHAYSLEEDAQSHTVQCFMLKTSLRRTLIGNTQEKGFPNLMEFVVSSTNAEFDPDEAVHCYRNSDRSLICAPLFSEDKCIGVMRVVRGGYQRSFSGPDARIFAKLVKYLPVSSCNKVAEDVSHYTT